MSELQDCVAVHTRELARWAAQVDFAQLPLPVARKAALVIADDLSAIVGARDEPEVSAFHRTVLARAQSPESTVYRGARPRTDRLSAAVANAVAGSWLELDEGYRVVSCHAGLYVLPALLAEAEAENLPVREVLRATVVGYEVVTRIASAFTPADASIHAHANYAAIGACAAVASARGLDAKAFLDALTAACTYCIAGPRNHMMKGALVRNTWAAVGTASGMMSVDWAQCGIGGVPESAYDALVGALRATAHPARLTAGLGTRWSILDGYTKLYACCQHAHSAVEATLTLRDRVLDEGPLDRIESITVETHPLALKLDNAAPPTTLGARFSLPHIVAATLAYGEAGERSFRSDTLADPAVAELRRRVRVAAYTRHAPDAPELAPPNDRPALVRVRLRDGPTLSGECLSAAGGPDRPFGEDAIMTKVVELTASAYPEFAAVMRRIASLDSAQLARGWRDVVTDFGGAATPA